MPLKRYSPRASVYLVSLAIVIFGLGVAMTLLLYATEQSLEDDARWINEAGMIRGSIQRLTKLALNDPGSVLQNGERPPIVDRIDRLIERFLLKGHMGKSLSSKESVSDIEQLNIHWGQLRRNLLDFSDQPSAALQAEIHQLSETCWVLSMQVVLSTQQETESRIQNIKLIFYLLLLFNLVSVLLVLGLVILYVRKKLEFESSHDPLTGLYNKRLYNKFMDREVIRASRYGLSLSIIMLDIDHFKQVNDRYGHGVGDRVLIELARLIEQSIRHADAAFRVGGEEFVILCPATTAPGAYRLADNLRQSVEENIFDNQLSLTISAGIAGFVAGMSTHDLYELADQCLYKAKSSGRNRVVMNS